MLRKFIILFLSTLCLVLSTASVHAEGEFTTDLDVTYKVNESGITTVSNRVTLTNVFSNLYATSYTLVLNNMKPKNIRAYNEAGSLETNISNENDKTNIQVNFPDSIVGKDKSRVFWISYDEESFAVRTGEIWEISIPRIPEGSPFSSYFATLSVPDSLGQEAYMSPLPISKDSSDGFKNYHFTKTLLQKTGVVAGFGQFQVFSFNLSYHLENPLNRSASTDIALPPDTAFQRIYYTNINPKPSAMHIDLDGNWIATYELKSRERVDITASGSVQIFSSIRNFPTPSDESLNKSLLPTTYWQVEDPKIKTLGQSLKTPKAIYDYVSQNLKYDYSRVRPNIERLGATNALQSPESAICMEFTDLFIALSRAAGIPAREINGYAYTENPEIQPLSLVNDVLHSWPEYYDFQKKAWIPVDPTWGSTTGGVDFFSKLDLRHFTFVIHGGDDTKPYAPGSYKLGANPQKDVFVSFGTLPEVGNSKVLITANVGGWIPFLSNRINLKIANPGPVAMYFLKPTIYFDKQKTDNDIYLETLLPFQTYTSSFSVPFSFLGTRTPENVTVNVQDETVTIPTNKNQVVIYNLIFIFVSSILILLTFLFRLKRWKIKLPIYRKSL